MKQLSLISFAVAVAFTVSAGSTSALPAASIAALKPRVALKDDSKVVIKVHIRTYRHCHGSGKNRRCHGPRQSRGSHSG